MLYTGDGTEVTDDRSLGLSGAVVMTLMEPYLDKNHVLYVDNWYTQVQHYLNFFPPDRQVGVEL